MLRISEKKDHSYRTTIALPLTIFELLRAENFTNIIINSLKLRRQLLTNYRLECTYDNTSYKNHHTVLCCLIIYIHTLLRRQKESTDIFHYTLMFELSLIRKVWWDSSFADFRNWLRLHLFACQQCVFTTNEPISNFIFFELNLYFRDTMLF